MSSDEIAAPELLNISELVQQAKTLPYDRRQQILAGIPETELHGHLKELFKAMEPSYAVEVTHGNKEHGKDLVLVKHDKLTIDVIGIVVKRGNIKAKTLGEVEELKSRINTALTYKSEMKTRDIESQIIQAFSHEAELKNFAEALPVNKVITIIAGELSSEARVRLEKRCPALSRLTEWIG